MASCVISGRVDESVRDKVSPILKRAGMSAGDLVKSLWEHVALTREIPSFEVEKAVCDAHSPYDDFISYCDTLPPSDAWFNGMDREGMRDVLAGEHA